MRIRGIPEHEIPLWFDAMREVIYEAADQLVDEYGGADDPPNWYVQLTRLADDLWVLDTANPN